MSLTIPAPVLAASPTLARLAHPTGPRARAAILAARNSPNLRARIRALHLNRRLHARRTWGAI